MEYLVGLLLALAVARVLPALAGIGHGRDFYPVMLIVVASYYVLFATMAGSGRTVLQEVCVAAAFVLAAVIGFRTQPWILAAGLAGHGLFDAIHHLVIDNPGVPDWWPGFCGTFDVVAGAVLATLLIKQRNSRPNAQSIITHGHTTLS